MGTSHDGKRPYVRGSDELYTMESEYSKTRHSAFHAQRLASRLASSSSLVVQRCMKMEEYVETNSLYAHAKF